MGSATYNGNASGGGSGGGSSSPPTWSTSLVRYFLLDNDGGLDTNVGYVDAAAGSTIDPTGKALKTHAALLALLPLNGNGHKVVVLAQNRAAGATYLGQDGVTAEDVDFSPYTGYSIFIVRGSSDLTNSATDRVQCGFITALAGTGTNGVFTVGAGSTTTSVTTQAGNSLTTDQAIGFRIRFVTGALAGQARNIQGHTSGTTPTFTLGQAAGGSAANGDTFLIERTGTRVNSLTYQAFMPGANFTTFGGPVFAGYGGTKAGFGALVFSQFGASFPIGMAGCEVTDTTAANQGIFVTSAHSFQCGATYTDEAGVSRNVGFGLRCGNGYGFVNVYNLGLANVALMGTSVGANVFQNIFVGTVGNNGSYFGGRAAFAGCGSPGIDRSVTQFDFVVGNGTSAVKTRSNGGFQFTRCHIAFDGIDFQNCSSSCVTSQTNGFGSILSVDNCSGSSGNTAFGVDLNASKMTQAAFGVTAANTVTGSSGDIRLANGPPTTHTAFTQVGFVDEMGNTYMGTAGIQYFGAVRWIDGDGTAHAIGEVVRISAANTVVRAQADTQGHADGALFVSLTTPAAGSGTGYYGVLGGDQKWVLHAAAPTLGAVSYLSPGTAGAATTTAPTPTVDRKRQLGIVSKVSGNFGLVVGAADLASVLA